MLLSAAPISAQVHAGDYRFETPWEGIADALARQAQEQPVRTRSQTRASSIRNYLVGNFEIAPESTNILGVYIIKDFYFSTNFSTKGKDIVRG